MFARFEASPDQLRMTIVARRDGLQDLTQPLEEAGSLSRDAAVVRIREEGANLDPPWIPSRKTTYALVPVRRGASIVYQQIDGSGGRTGFDTGNLMRSITWELEGASTVRTGTNVPYARWFQFGSGIFGVGPNEGHTGWTIVPREKKALSWVFGGRRFFAREVHAQGQPPRPFLLFDLDLIEAIIAAFQRWVGAKR